MAGNLWGEGPRGGIFGARVDPALLRELEKRAEAKRQMAQGLESAGSPARIEGAFEAAESMQEPSRALYEAKHRRAQGLPPETSFLENVASLGPRAVGGAQKMAAAAPGALRALWEDPLGTANRVGQAGQAATDAIVRGAVKPFTQFGRTDVDPVQQAVDLASVVGTGGLATAGGRSGVGVFGGRLAKTADIGRLTRATDMKNGGFTPEEIWKETGWFQGADDKWRFEIPDQPAKFVPGKSNPLNRIELAQQRFAEQTGQPPLRFATPKWSTETSEALKWVDDNMGRLSAETPTDPLSNVLVHPDLYAAYPEMANMATKPERLRHMELEGSFDPRLNQITYGGSEMLGHGTPERNRSTLLHEAQHAIQEREGFAKGGTPREFALGQEDLANTQQFIREYGTALDLLREVDERKVGLEAATKEYKELGLADERLLARAKDIISSFEPAQIKNIYDKYARNIELGAREGREGYHRLAGEVEARNVQERADRIPQGMKDLPEYTEDVPRGRQIVRGHR